MLKKQFIFKDEQQESFLIKRRIYFSGIIIALSILSIIIRVFYLTVIQHSHFTTLAKSNRFKIVPIQPTRGLIYSRDGIILADNKPSFSLDVVPEKIENIEALINELRQVINIEENDVLRFKKALRKKRRFENVFLKFNLTDEDVALFSVNRHRFSGVDVAAKLSRYYPFSDELVHAIGYVARIDEDDIKELEESNYRGMTHIGKLGIERSYESILHGEIGYQQVEVNAQGRVIRILDRTLPKPGKNIHLTLDLSLQKIAIASLNGRKGAIVAIDPNNGDVLAFVSSPSYDPNKFVNGIDNKSYTNLLLSRDKPLINRLIQGKYPPGSTIKPFMGFVGLNEGIRNMTDKLWCPGWFSLKGQKHRYRDWKKEGHGHTNLHKAITQSCDVYFYVLAHELGIDRIVEGLSKFGFGRPTGIDIVGELNGLLPSKKWKREVIGQSWFPGETLITGIGQGYMLVTPLQLAKATAILANKGKIVTPRLMLGTSNLISGKINKVASKFESEVNIENRFYWDDIIDSMRDVVHEQRGTAWQTGLNAEYEFAGKTGTAQVMGILQDQEYKKEEIKEELRDHALFIAFAPVKKPRLVLAILVENGGSGSNVAAPIARELFDHFMHKYSLIETR